MLFSVEQRYHCQDTGKNIHFLALIPVLRHSLFYQHFGGNFGSIYDTVARLQAKIFIHQYCNWFYGIRCSIFSTLEVIFSRSKVPLPRFGRKCSFVGFETSFTAFAVLFLELGTVANKVTKMFIHWFIYQFYGIRCCIFITFEVIMSQLRVQLPRYGRKHSFPGF